MALIRSRTARTASRALDAASGLVAFGDVRPARGVAEQQAVSRVRIRREGVHSIEQANKRSSSLPVTRRIARGWSCSRRSAAGDSPPRCRRALRSSTASVRRSPSRHREARRRAEHEPLHHPSLRLHAGGARLPRAGSRTPLSPRSAGRRHGHVRAGLDGAARQGPRTSARTARADRPHGLPGGARRHADPLRRPAARWRRGQHAVDLDLGAGARMPAQCTAMGKVLLAYLPEREREQQSASWS